MSAAPTHCIEFSAPCWLWVAEKSAWHFVSLPPEAAAEVAFFSQNPSSMPKRRGWGAVKVAVQIGATQWATSVFPDKKNNSYILPLKRSVRAAENVQIDGMVRVVLTLRLP